MNDNVLAVNEIYEIPTFQGEGKNLGMPCYFLRLAGCNLACTFCDTPYAWDWTGKNGKVYDVEAELHPYHVVEVYEQLERQAKVAGIRNLVISGGEPMLQQKPLSALIDNLQRLHHWWIEIETAGTRAPIPENTANQFTVSLKLLNSGNSYAKRHKPEAIKAFVADRRSVFKFVICNEDDMSEVAELALTYGIAPSRIYVMPEGKDANTIQQHSQLVAQEVVRRGWNLTTRLQVQLYGNQRGI